MDTRAEAHDRLDRSIRRREATDVEGVGVGEVGGIVIGRAEQGDDAIAGLEVETCELNRVEADPCVELDRRVEPQSLLDRRRHQGRIGPERSERLGVRQQLVDSVTDQVGRGLGAGREQEDRYRQDLVLGEPIVAVRGDDEARDEVLSGVGPARGDQCSEVIEQHLVRGFGRPQLFEGRVGFEDGHQCGHMVADLGPVGGRDAQHLADDRDRQRLGDQFHEIAASCIGQLVEAAIDQFGDPRLQFLDRSRGECPADQAPLAGVTRRVEAQHRQRALVDAPGLAFSSERQLRGVGASEGGVGHSVARPEPIVPEQRPAVVVPGEQRASEARHVHWYLVLELSVERRGLGGPLWREEDAEE